MSEKGKEKKIFVSKRVWILNVCNTENQMEMINIDMKGVVLISKWYGRIRCCGWHVAMYMVQYV